MLIGNWEVSPTQGVITRGDEKVKLEPKVTEVMAYLATRPGEEVSRDDIEQAVWPNACCWPFAGTQGRKLVGFLGTIATDPSHKLDSLD